MGGLGAWFRGLSGTNENVDPALSLIDQPAGSSGGKSFAKDNNDFTIAMYAQLRQGSGNIFVSPFSIRIALGMTLAGARGETAAQMREALCISSSDETLHTAVAKIIQQLNAAGGGHYQMAVANSLWGQNDKPLLADFLKLIARHYDGGSLNLVDFRSDAETARRTINQWVGDKTQHRIRELIPSGGLDDETRLILANAIYFKGMWELPFPKTATHDAPFYLEGGGTVRASLMHQHERVRYVHAGDYQAVDLSYRGGDLSMLVLLPDRQVGLRDLEERLTERMLHDCVARLETPEVKLFLPQFQIACGTVNVRDPLAALGMPLAFSRGDANFSGINGLEPPHEDSLWISKVFHKTFVEVNEEGTEAAAATAVILERLGSSAPPPPIPIFRADHPFLFAIRDRRSGTILFFGRMSDPTQED